MKVCVCFKICDPHDSIDVLLVTLCYTFSGLLQAVGAHRATEDVEFDQKLK